MSYLKRTEIFLPRWVGACGIVLKVAFAFAVVIWLSSFGGLKGAFVNSSVSALKSAIGK